MNATAPASELVEFTLHPAIIKTIINEQAGSVSKAVAELVMNSIDAGATAIHLTKHNDHDFTLSDDGKGFNGKEEIESFFRTFGTPHEENDANFGKFRVGRGQIMAFAATSWRSGHHEMKVDLQRNADFLGFELLHHDTFVPGCSITVQLYRDSDTNFIIFDATEFYVNSFVNLIKYVSVPVYVDGKQINTLPDNVQWDDQDDMAYYRYDRKSSELLIYNQGVYVCTMQAKEFGTGGVVCSKGPLSLNMARNSIIQHAGHLWPGIKQHLRNRFRIELSRFSKLTEAEIINFLNAVNVENLRVDYINKKHFERYRKMRFISDIFGNLRSADEFLMSSNFTIYDGVHQNIAESVQKNGMASVLTHEFLRHAGIDPKDVSVDDLVRNLLVSLRKVFRIQRPAKITSFTTFVRDLDGTVTYLDENELNPKEKAVLAALNDINSYAAQITGETAPRSLRVGVSDTMEAWTDGFAFLTINRATLNKARTEMYGPTFFINLLIHEYCHSISTKAEHSHDFDFFNHFHNVIMGKNYHDVVLSFIEAYTIQMIDIKVVPSTSHRKMIDRIAKLQPKLPSRNKR